MPDQAQPQEANDPRGEPVRLEVATSPDGIVFRMGELETVLDAGGARSLGDLLTRAADHTDGLTGPPIETPPGINGWRWGKGPGDGEWIAEHGSLDLKMRFHLSSSTFDAIVGDEVHEVDYDQVPTTGLLFDALDVAQIHRAVASLQEYSSRLATVRLGEGDVPREDAGARAQSAESDELARATEALEEAQSLLEGRAQRLDAANARIDALERESAEASARAEKAELDTMSRDDRIAELERTIGVRDTTVTELRQRAETAEHRVVELEAAARG